MIVRTRWRVSAPPARRPRPAPRFAATSARLEGDDAYSEPWGQEYGAGPSSIPYQPPASSPATHVRYHSTTRHSAHHLRRQLAELPPGAYGSPIAFVGKLAKVTGRGKDDTGKLALSPLEKHVVLHHLIKTGNASIAVGFATHVLDERIAAGNRPDRRLFAERTLEALGNRASYRRLPTHTKKFLNFRSSHLVPQPTIEEQRPTPMSKQLTSMLDLVDRLQRVRHRRPEALYALVIQQCLNELRPDEAAKVYVGLVEEWIIEGRVAEGADPADFHAGGGPARDKKSRSALHNMWFKGIRTWRLPGEVLSPHDQLDLWHPHQVALGERLRGFPMPIPTSPPSLVPRPALQLLQPILSALAKDPLDTTPAHYAASLRALAMLANTVLSRTLPLPAVPKLLKAFSESHTNPAVYPATFDTVPENSWAYTANTQVHLALVSLLLSPPNYLRAAEIEEEQKLATSSALPEPAGPAQYMLHPLGWKSCMVLVNYTLKKLREPRMVTRLFEYMRSTFENIAPRSVNLLLREATRTRDNEFANVIDDKMFGHTPLARNDKVVGEISEAKDDPPILVDQFSLAALVSHLTATSQFERLVSLVYTVMPFLAVSKQTSAEDIAALAETHRAQIGYRGRIVPTEMDPRVLTTIVVGLVKAGHTGLAQRVFHTSRSLERKWATEMEMGEGGETVSPGQTFQLPIAMFTVMIDAYGAESRRRGGAVMSRVGWVVPPELSQFPRHVAGQAMAWRLYGTVVQRWHASAGSGADGVSGPLWLPDARFFNAVIRAMRVPFGLDSPYPLSPKASNRLGHIVEHMYDLGLTPPEGLLSKLQTGRVEGPIYFRVNIRSTSPTVDRKVFAPAMEELYDEALGPSPPAPIAVTPESEALDNEPRPRIA